jgi:hypothetical protein
MSGVFKFENGNEVKDSITGFTGVVVARTEWLNGCIRYVVQSRKMGVDKKLIDNTFDEQQLSLLHPPKPVKIKKERPGGPFKNTTKFGATPRKF